MKSAIFNRRGLLMAAGGFAFLPPAARLPAGEAPKPRGAAVLTIAGRIGKENRAGYDAGQDLFFTYHGKTFAHAFELDRAMLEELGMKQATLAYAAWPEPINVEGPLLRDVLTAADATQGKIRMTALDGFTTEMAWNDLTKEAWIVALSANGKPLGIGQRGPSWVVYSRRDGKPATAEDEARWPWAAFLIEIE
ncbi:MAG TPA: hypothetical protein VIB38_13785 [Aestuariivirgaceae bacterium]|jgi:hypothetical protein